ncbi:Hypothetical Protein FCC1311_043042 [Hondaea fermentalgiana]|uniref:Secreted protein n=1 Tax=Hondaea fermentalgiana TaxID=2315210 RepID=A0A2R5GIH2_9STRA|nr:Hypothetical Protein FCC1311_043042 [Hondaea fermentalgiana]|eukprot:GBG28081.1 Hypothetical Protein FCC1311_043042 [Hondaea fermentalgiana]
MMPQGARACFGLAVGIAITHALPLAASIEAKATPCGQRFANILFGRCTLCRNQALSSHPVSWAKPSSNRSDPDVAASTESR